MVIINGVTIPFHPTPEQMALFNLMPDIETQGNLVIQAVAGSGKTTTIEWASKLLPVHLRTAFMAFNKHIVDELKTRVPEHIKVSTFHSLGWWSVKKKYPQAKMDEEKCNKIVMGLMRTWKSKQPELDSYDYSQKIITLCHLARLTLSLNEKKLIAIGNKHEMEVDRLDCIRVFKVLERMTADTTTFDYTDMIYLPATDKRFPIIPNHVVFVDEAQDMSLAVQSILKRMLAGGGRFIAVGDPSQNIMSFAGTDEFSFKNLCDMPGTKVLPLSVSFRCAKNIVLKAQEIVPEIQYRENAVEGIVARGSVLKQAESGDFVLCRRADPLLSMFFQLIMADKKVSFNGVEYKEQITGYINPWKKLPATKILENLRDNIKEFGKVLQLKTAINSSELIHHPAYRSQLTLFNGLKTLAGFSDGSGAGMLAVTEQVFAAKNQGIILSTCHKSKGLEAKRVFIICPKTLGAGASQAWQYKQEQNLKYVAVTRAKEELYFDHDWKYEPEDLNLEI